jgi:hypothetical protein
MRVSLLLCGVVACATFVPALSAQDAVKTDPKHYTVVSENDEVRILKVHYGPHEKSIMHSHPDAVAVFLSDSTATFHLPDGTSMVSKVKAGESRFTKAGTHLPENMGDKGMDVVLIELKKK